MRVVSKSLKSDGTLSVSMKLRTISGADCLILTVVMSQIGVVLSWISSCVDELTLLFSCKSNGCFTYAHFGYNLHAYWYIVQNVDFETGCTHCCVLYTYNLTWMKYLLFLERVSSLNIILGKKNKKPNSNSNKSTPWKRPHELVQSSAAEVDYLLNKSQWQLLSTH